MGLSSITLNVAYISWLRSCHGTQMSTPSISVMKYLLCRLSGLSPFMGDNDAETFANITRADYDFDDEAFDAISQDAKDFISALLVKRKE